MPKYNVKLPDGRWRCLSTVVDDWITEPMDFESYKAWRREEYTRQTDEESDSLLTDRPRINVMSYEDAVKYLELYEEKE